MDKKRLIPIILTIFLTNLISATSLMEKWGIQTNQDFNIILLKYFLLLMFFALIYGILSFMKFFDNSAIRIGIAIIISILLSLTINPNEMASTIILYKSLYLTIILFFPLLVIGTLTFKALEKFDSFGIFLQKILWGIYGLYLLFISIGILLFSNNFLKGLNEIFPFNYLWTYLFKYIWMFYEFFGILKEDNITGFLLLIVSLLILYFMIINNEQSTKIMKDWIKDAKILKEKDTNAKFNAAQKIMAKAVDNA